VTALALPDAKGAVRLGDLPIQDGAHSTALLVAVLNAEIGHVTQGGEDRCA